MANHDNGENLETTSQAQEVAPLKMPPKPEPHGIKRKKPTETDVSLMSGEVSMMGGPGSPGSDGAPSASGSKDILVTPGYGNTLNQLSQLDFKFVKHGSNDLSQPQDSEIKVSIYPYGERVSGDGYDSPVLVIGGTWNNTRFAPHADYISSGSSSVATIWIHPRSGKIEATSFNAGAGGYNGVNFTENADGFSIAGGSSNERTFTLSGGNLSANQGGTLSLGGNTLALASGNLTLTSGNNNPNLTIPNTATATAVVNTSSFTQYGVVFSSSATNGIVASTGQGASGQPLVGAGAANPAFGNVNVGSYATGTLPIGNGGTGTNSSPTLGQALFGNNSSGYTLNQIAVTSPITIAHNATSGQPTVGINASSTNTNNYVVQRDGSGNFSAGTITASSIVLTTGTISTSPSGSTDIVNKSYVDSVASGIDVRQSCRLATAAALPAHNRSGNTLTATSNGALTVDGVAVAVSDRILVKDEGSGTHLENGIYTVTATGSAGAAWVLDRAADADTSAEVTAGIFTFIEEGTQNADSGWVLTTNNPITLNTTALSFSQFSGAGSINAGTGLNKSGNTIAANIGLDNAQASNQIRFTGGSGSNNSASAGNAGTSVTFDVKTNGSGTITLQGNADGFSLQGGATGRTILVTGSSFTFTGGASTFDIVGGTGTSRTLTVNQSGTLSLGGFTLAVTGANKTLAGTKSTLTLGGSGTDGITINTNADGFDIAGGTTSRTLTVTGGNVTLTSGSNNPNVTIPNTATATAVVNTSAFTQYGVVFSSSATNGIVGSTAQGASGQPLVGAGAANPAFGNVDVGQYATGVLPIANGGTNSNAAQLSVTAGRIVYADGTRLVSLATPTASANGVLFYGTAPTWTGTTTTAGRVLQSQASGTPQWTDLITGGAISAGNGISISTASPNVISLNEAYNGPTWTGAHIWRGAGVQIQAQDSADSNVAKFRIDLTAGQQSAVLGRDIGTATALQPFPLTWPMTAPAAGTVTAKRVVKLNTTAGEVSHTGASENDIAVGVAVIGGSNGAAVRIARLGRVTVTADTTAVAVGDYITCVASGQVTSAGATKPASGGWIGRALTSKSGGAGGDIDILLELGAGGAGGGSGTQYTLAMWSNAAGTVLGDSMVTQNSGGSECYIGGDNAADKLVIGGTTAASTLTLNSNGQTTAAFGIAFGTDGNNVTLYRSANDTLKTDDSMVVTGSLTAGNSGVSVGSNGNTTVAPAATGTTVLTLKSHSSDDNVDNKYFIDFKQSNNSSIMQMTTSGKLLSKGKSFDIEHPTREGWRLQYGSLEGPEYGAYDRGEACGRGLVEVVLPHYWHALVEKGATILVSSRGPYSVFVVRREVGKFWVRRTGVLWRWQKCCFDYCVIASRQDIKTVVEYRAATS